jgi:hypothetical protein
VGLDPDLLCPHGATEACPLSLTTLEVRAGTAGPWKGTDSGKVHFQALGTVHM